jgi:hypothetical protein
MSDLERWSRPWLAERKHKEAFAFDRDQAANRAAPSSRPPNHYSERERQKNDANYLPY